MSLTFEWDDIKSVRNLKKHSVSFDEAKTVFNDPLARITDDKGHSILEKRWQIIGLSINNRIIITAYAEKNDRIRIISARKAEPSERRKYEKYNNNLGLAHCCFSRNIFVSVRFEVTRRT